MANTIDERVVSMKFDNNGFQDGVDKTNKALDSLKKGLDLNGAAKGINDVSSAANKIDLSHIGSAVDAIKSKFSILGVAGVTAIANITTSALNFAKNKIGDVLGPIIQGGTQRAHAIEQAKFQFQGLGLNIQQTMDASLAAVKGTAFGLDEAATAAAQFGASGITATNGLTPVLKSIAGVAAQTGSQFGDIANIFESVAGNGRLMGNDLLQLSSRGVNAAAILGKSLGKSESDVREMVTKGQISFQQFSDAMNKAFGANASKASETYSGALDNMHAALSRLGADIETPKFEAQRKLFNALTPAIDAAHAAMLPFITDVGKLENAASDRLVKSIGKLKFTGLSATAKGATSILNNLSTAAQTIGTYLHAAFKVAFFDPKTVGTLQQVINGLVEFSNVIKNGVQKNITNIYRTFLGFFSVLDIVYTVVKGLIGVIVRLFGAFDGGGGSILKVTGGIGFFLYRLDQAIKKGNGLTTFFRILGDVLVKPIQLIKSFGEATTKAVDPKGVNVFGKALSNVQDRLHPLEQLVKVIGAAFGFIGKAISYLGQLFAPVLSKFDDFFHTIGKSLVNAIKTEDFSGVLSLINAGLFGGILLLVSKFVNKLNSGHFKVRLGLIDSIKGSFSALTGTLATMQNKLKVEVLQKIAITIALLSASVIALSFVDPKRLAGSLSAITVMMGQLLGLLAAFEKIEGPKGILRIIATGAALILFASAIDILTIAVVALGRQNIATLAKGLGGLTALLAIVTVTANKLPNNVGLIKTAGAMLVLGVALNVLAQAVKTLGSLDLASLAKGLGGVTFALALLVGFSKTVKTSGLGPSQAIGLLALSGAIYILGKAVAVFGNLPIDALAKGVGALGAVLLELSLFSRFTKGGVSLIGVGVGMLAVGAAMLVLAKAVAQLGSLNIQTLGKGLLGLAGIMATLVIAFRLLPNPIVLLAAGLAFVGVATGVTIIAQALKTLGGMSLAEIGKGLLALAGGLGIIAVTLILMTEALPGAAALLVAAGAIAVLVPSLVLLGGMSLGDIGKGLLALAGAFLVIGVGGAALGIASPLIAAAGVAIILLGSGIALFGAGVAAFAVGVTLLAAAGSAGAASLTVFVTSILGLLPLAANQLGLAIVSFAKVIGGALPTFVTAMSTLIIALAIAIGKAAPQVINTLVILLNSLLGAVSKNLPSWLKMGAQIVVEFLTGIASFIGPVVKAGVNLAVQFLNGVAANVGKLVTAGTNVVIAFIRGVGSNAIRLANAGADTLVNFINGLAGAIRSHQSALDSAGRNLASAIVSGMTGGLSDHAGDVVKAAENLAGKIPDAIKNLLHINSPSRVVRAIVQSVGEGAVLGLNDGEDDVDTASQSLGKKIITGLNKAMASVSDAVSVNLDSAPSIRPVLDLDQVKKDASTISGLLPNPSISVGGTVNTANSAIAGADANAAITRSNTSDAAATTPVVKQQVTFNQTNTSPKALSAIEIYRQTHNQLAAAKEALV